MRRYWLPSISSSSRGAQIGDLIPINGDSLHHIRDVCRMRIGSRFEIIMDGSAYLVEIESESKHESKARVLESRTIAALPHPHLILALSIPRFPVFEAVVEKAVELGVHAIQPFYSDFSFIRTQSDVWDKKKARFQKINESATQQSGRGNLMEIHQPIGFDELLQTFNRTGQASGLFAYEGDGVLNAKDGVGRIAEGRPNEVWVFVGSEGGFSNMEVRAFRDFGLEPVTLGSQVLRVETACVALISVLKYGLDLMR